MDKNHIKIDDLVRSRLSGAEEREPAGAWQNMRELLDKEMPVRAAAFDWRRMLGYASVLILASSVTVGGYNYYRHSVAPHSGVTIAPAATIPFADFSKRSALSTPNVVSDAFVATNSTPTHSSKKSNRANTISSLPAKHSGIAKQTSMAMLQQPANNASEPVLAANNENSHSSLAKKVQEFKQPEVDFTGKTGTVQSSTSITTDQAAKANPATNTGGPAVAGADMRDQRGVASLPVSAQRASAQIADNNIQQAPMLASAATFNNPGTMPALKGNIAASNVRKDTIRQIEIAYHTERNNSSRATTYRRDTLSVTKIVVDRQKPEALASVQKPATSGPQLSPAPTKTTALRNSEAAIASSAMNPANPVPQSAANVAASENIQLVSLSKFKVASRFRNIWNAERFSFMVQQVKADLSKAQFYAGITGGINASLFGSSSLAGIQAGITGLLAFNDRWSVAGELKFYQRFNTGGSIKDNYVTVSEAVAGNYTTVNGMPYREWTWKQDTVSHSYNFTAIQTLELPVLLRRNFGRFLAEAGLNMMYAFAVNTEEIDKPNGNPAMVSRQLPADATKESLSGSKQTIKPGDFGSRFGIGYALGAGYQLTPAFQMNLRMVQSVWDNANSTGASRVSQNLYQTPSLQISVGYRFKQGKGK